jgi:glutathione S-transferase
VSAHAGFSGTSTAPLGGTPTVYGMSASGNCYKVRLLLEQLGLAYRWVEVDSVGGQTRTPEFLARNPNGKVPLLELADGRRLAESNAILCYLAEGSALLPADAWRRAQVLQWLFFEQYSHEPYVAVARFIAAWLPPDHPRHAELPRLRDRGHAALALMEAALATREFLVDGGYSVADIALYAYTHDAPRGGIALDRYPALRAWLARVEATPGFVPQSP